MTKHLRSSVAAFAVLAVVLVGCQTDDAGTDTTDVETDETLDDGLDADADADLDAEVEEEETEG